MFYVITFSYSLWLLVKPLIQPTRNQIVKESGKVSLTCSIVEGDAPVEITWLKDDERLPHSLGIKIVRVEDMSILRIPSVHSVHNGNYTCLAKNMAGNYSETAEIRVKGRTVSACSLGEEKKLVNIEHVIFLSCRTTYVRNRLNIQSHSDGVCKKCWQKAMPTRDRASL